MTPGCNDDGRDDFADMAWGVIAIAGVLQLVHDVVYLEVDESRFPHPRKWSKVGHFSQKVR